MMGFGDDADVAFVAPKGYEHASSGFGLLVQLSRNGVGEEAVERQGQDNVGIHGGLEVDGS